MWDLSVSDRFIVVLDSSIVPFFLVFYLFIIIEMTTLSNGIRVCTERTSHQTASVSVFVGAGSRNEDLETSGSAYLLEKMFLRGTSSRNKSEIA